MGLFGLLGAALTLPIKVVELPVRVVEEVALDDTPVADTLKDVRRTIQNAANEVDED